MYGAQGHIYYYYYCYLEGAEPACAPLNAANINPPPNGDCLVIRMHGTADVGILRTFHTAAQNIFLVYHLNFGSVLTGVHCWS